MIICTYLTHMCVCPHKEHSSVFQIIIFITIEHYFPRIFFSKYVTPFHAPKKINSILGCITRYLKQSLTEPFFWLELAHVWETRTCPWIKFVSQVLSSSTTRGGCNWSTEYFLWRGKAPYLYLGLFGPNE